jgi:hypothetical protein
MGLALIVLSRSSTTILLIEKGKTERSVYRSYRFSGRWESPAIGEKWGRFEGGQRFKVETPLTSNVERSTSNFER